MSSPSLIKCECGKQRRATKRCRHPKYAFEKWPIGNVNRVMKSANGVNRPENRKPVLDVIRWR